MKARTLHQPCPSAKPCAQSCQGAYEQVHLYVPFGPAHATLDNAKLGRMHTAHALHEACMGACICTLAHMPFSSQTRHNALASAAFGTPLGVPRSSAMTCLLRTAAAYHMVSYRQEEQQTATDNISHQLGLADVGPSSLLHCIVGRTPSGGCCGVSGRTRHTFTNPSRHNWPGSHAGM